MIFASILDSLSDVTSVAFAVVAFALFVYLLAALLRPERF